MRAATLAGCLLLLLPGCGALMTRGDEPTGGESPLRAARGSGDAVTLDVFWANLPAEGPGFDRKLWRFVQEDRIDPEQRTALLSNGLRAGVVGGAPPEVIVRLLDPLGRRRKAAAEDVDGGAVSPESQVDADFTEQTGVRGRTLTARPGKPVTLLASQVYDEAIVLGADLTGETFREVQAVYTLRVGRDDRGGYQVSLTPELHMGQPRMEWVRDETNMIAYPTTEREKRVYDDLRIEAPLVLGEMLLVTSLPDASSELGRYFHEAESSPEGRRKAILVRLTQAPPDPAFAAARDAAEGS